MGKLERLPGINSENTRRRNVLVGSAYLLAGCVGLAALAGDSDDDPGIENGNGEVAASDDDEPESEGIQSLFAESIEGGGLATAISERGREFYFGLDRGDIVSITEDEDRSDIVTTVDRGVSHILPSEGRDEVIVGWLDAHSFGEVNPDGSLEWGFEFDGFWDLAASEDYSEIAVVTFPNMGAGHVGFVRNGVEEWTVPLEEAASESVAITPDGDQVAVGAIEYWSDALETSGTPGIHFFSDTGEREWVYETDWDVLETEITAQDGLITAFLDDGTIIALNFDGELEWAIEDQMSHGVSADGSTVVALGLGEISAFDTTGDELWSGDLEISPVGFDQPSVSGDGDRVLVSARIDSELSLVERGETVWTEAWDDGPVIGALSHTGDTWSAVLQNNEEETVEMFGFRDFE